VYGVEIDFACEKGYTESIDKLQQLSDEELDRIEKGK
jgi:hypothetical protein